MYSSGSFAPSICSTIKSSPMFCKTSIALTFAVCPASSESKLNITFSAFFLSKNPCCCVSAVPSAPTTFFTPLWCNDITSMYPSTIRSCFVSYFFATFSPNRFLPLLYTTFSGEFMYFGLLSSNTLPPNAITLPLTSHIGNISLFLYLSMYCPFSFLFTRPDSNISASPKPCFFSALYNSLNFPENPIW